MFWGEIIKPGQPYFEEKAKSSIHITMAALDTRSCSENHEPMVDVKCTDDNKDYLLCTLNKNNKYQYALDFYIEEGRMINIRTVGYYAVHLTGYYIGKPRIISEPSNLGIDPDSDNKENKDGEREEKGEKGQVKTAEPGGQVKDEEKEKKDKKNTKKDGSQKEMSPGEGTSSGTKRIMKAIKKK